MKKIITFILLTTALGIILWSTSLPVRNLYAIAKEQGTEIDTSKNNYLKIDKIGVNGVIYEGDNENTLMQGIWRRPNSSNPEKGGNTVLTSHRFLYSEGPDTFYNLDKIEKGDFIEVFWDNVLYTYEVFYIDAIEPTKVEIEDNTFEDILTLYTCTPLGSDQLRLVVRAKLIK